MKNIMILILICVFLTLPSLSFCRGTTGNINLLFGRKQINDSRLEKSGLGNSAEFGVLIDIKGNKRWPASIEINAFTSNAEEILDNTIYGDNIKVSWSTDEFGVGLRKYLDQQETVGPFLGAGIAWIHGVFEENDNFNKHTNIKSGSALAPWANIGLMFKGSGINFGINIRQSFGKVNLKGTVIDNKVKAGGTHTGFFFGISFD